MLHRKCSRHEKVGDSGKMAFDHKNLNFHFIKNFCRQENIFEQKIDITFRFFFLTTACFSFVSAQILRFSHRPEVIYNQSIYLFVHHECESQELNLLENLWKICTQICTDLPTDLETANFPEKSSLVFILK